MLHNLFMGYLNIVSNLSSLADIICQISIIFAFWYFADRCGIICHVVKLSVFLIPEVFGNMLFFTCSS